MEFLVMPDCAAAGGLADTLADLRPVRVLRHASGRPWLLGNWADDEIVHVAHGDRRLALIGRTTMRPETLAAALRGVSGLSGLDSVAAATTGGFHLVASFDGTVRVQGGVSTIRQVFHTRIGGTAVAASRAYRIAGPAGARIDPTALALRMMTPLPPWPLIERSPWSGVHQTPPGCYLLLTPSGDSREVRWWRPPPADVPLAVGVRGIREAVSGAVAARAHGGGVFSADLSGGMDSTSLCFAAAAAGAEAGADLVTTHLASPDPGNDDRLWADRAAGAMPGARHHVLDRRSLPAWFDLAAEPGPELDAPFAWVRARARLAHLAHRYRAFGSTRHLVGHGGDELFDVAPSYLHGLVRHRPLEGLRHVRAGRALYRWRLGPTVRALADRTDFPGSLRAVADSLTATITPADPASVLGWGTGARMPVWSTPEAVEAVRGAFRNAAAAVTGPLAPSRVHHQTLDLVRQIGEMIRQVDALTCPHGITWEAPYLDDRVIEATMAVRLTDRAAPRRYKPVLVAAMRGTVPDEVLGRMSKAEFSAEAYSGLRRNRRALLETADDMHLARAGLVDVDAFRRALVAPHPSAHTMIPFDATLACESWLRSVASAAPMALPTGVRP